LLEKIHPRGEQADVAAKDDWLFLIFCVCSVSFLHTAKAQIINNGASSAYWQLNSKNFSDYAVIPGSGGWVNIGNCGSLTFTAGMEIGHAFARHTLIVWLKRDGATVATEQKMIGPSLVPTSFTLNFPAVGLTPGQWEIGWLFLDSVNSTDSASIKLIAPIKNPQPPPYNPADFCGSGFSGVSGNLCNYEPALSTGFIYNNSYYRTATNITSACPPPQVSVGGGICRVGMAPAVTFVHNNSLYYRPLGSIGHGINNAQPPFTGGTCPNPTSTNYTVAHDSWGCLVTPVPATYWQQPLPGGLALLLTERKNGTCAQGSFDGANCFLRSPPPGSTALVQGGVWYWTPRYCN
jgi:hypothetical protein